METSSATNAASPTSRMIIQQCFSAKLEVRPAAADTDAEFVQVFIVLFVFHGQGRVQLSIRQQADFR